MCHSLHVFMLIHADSHHVSAEACRHARLALSCHLQAVASGLQAGKVVGAVAKVCGGGGGGKPQLAQAGGKDASKLPEALALARSMLGLQA